MKQLFIPGLDDAPAEQQVPDDFDMMSVRSGLPTSGNVSFAMSFINSLKCFVGIGVLATPAVFAKIGIVGANLGMLFIGYLAYYTMMLQI